MPKDDFITRVWFKGSPLYLIFLPLSWLYGLVTAIRRFFYSIGISKSYSSKIPVIVVGNIMVGGNGKTPVVIALAEFFKKKGLRVGVVSRGYKATPPKYPYTVNDTSQVKEAGDEPKLIQKRTGALVVIDPIRKRAVQSIEDKLDVIITDDGLQHYALGRDIEIVVIDGLRRFGNGHLMPAGPLREGPKRLDKVDFLINNGGDVHGREYKMTLAIGEPYSLSSNSANGNSDNANDSHASKDSNGSNNSLLKGAKVCALAGIGDPSRFYKTVTDLGYTVETHLVVGDHGTVELQQLKEMSEKYPILMTEKDMVKYDFSDIKNVYAVPVTAALPDDFYQKLWDRYQQVKK